jgi:DNA ligase-1
MTTFRPMLADNKKVTQQQLQAHLDEAPLIMQPKIDGMRVLIDDAAIPRTRSGKEHKNRYLRDFCRHHPSLRGLDGEVASGLQMRADTFRDSMSGIRSEDGSPEFTFYFFDFFLEPWCANSYTYRRAAVAHTLSTLAKGTFSMEEGHTISSDVGNYTAKLMIVPQKLVSTLDEINEEEERLLTLGWEGAILRKDDRQYKYNRSTNREGSLIKLKRFEDDEAVITGCYPWEVNENEATTSPLGFTARSAHQGNKRAIDRLGGFHCHLLRDPSVTFDIGVFRGWSHSDRDRLWADRESLPGRIIKFAHQGYGGGYDRPRTPVGLGFRDVNDL